MKRRDLLKALSISFCPAILRQEGDTTSGKPNIVLCMADDQGWGDMAYYGHPQLKTPNFDRMAARGLRFDRFYAAAPVCSPTRGSVMTGRNPNRFGCFQWGFSIRPQEITIGDACRKAGYVTGHFGKWHLGSVLEGSPVNPGASGFDEWLSSPNFFDNDPILSREGRAVQTRGESSMVAVEAALEFIRRHSGKGDRPFLAVVWFGSPHSPHLAVSEDQAPYLGQEEELKNFYGEITGMDRAFGRLRDEIETLGIRENTLLWYCSDNGGLPGLSRTGGREFKGSIYEGGLRVPAILEWPRLVRSPRVTALPCVTSDIYPTILDILDLRMPGQPEIDGTSLLPLIRGKSVSRRKPFGFWNRPEGGIVTPSKEWMEDLMAAQAQGREFDDEKKLRLEAGVIGTRYPEDTYPGHAAWLDWPWKLHRIEDDAGGVIRELYNLEADPMEENDLSPRETGRREAMNRQLEAWLGSVTRSLNGKDYQE